MHPVSTIMLKAGCNCEVALAMIVRNLFLPCSFSSVESQFDLFEFNAYILNKKKSIGESLGLTEIQVRAVDHVFGALPNLWCLYTYKKHEESFFFIYLKKHYKFECGRA